MRAMVVVAALLLAGCEREPSEAEKAAAVAAAVAEVEANQEAPPEPVVPQKITFADIEKHGLFGAGCNFRPSGAATEPTFLAMQSRAIMKRDGEIIRLAADKGSRANPLGSWQQYDGKAFAAELRLAPGDGNQVGMETVDYAAQLTLRDGRDRVVYDARGTAQCGS